MQLTDFLQLFPNAKRSGGQYLAKCPAHDDRSASLSITEKDGKILLKCFAGCEYHSVRNALGLTDADLRTTERQERDDYDPTFHKDFGKRAATYVYTDEKGEELFAMLRYEKTVDGKRHKEMRPALKDNSPRGYRHGIGKTRRVPYNLPAVRKAIEEGRTVFVCEGEKDCDNLAKWGLTATTNPFGGGNWKAEYAEYLTGADVVLLPDNDATGRGHVQDVASTSKDKAARLRMLLLPNLPPKGDFSDWMAAGGTREQFLDLVEYTPDYTEMEAHFSLLSEKYHFQHTSDIEVPNEYETFGQWANKGQQLRDNDFEHDKRRNIARAKWYLGNIKNMERGNKGKTLRTLFGDQSRHIENLASAIKTFAEEETAYPDRMPVSFLKKLAPVPQDVRREGVERYRRGEMRSVKSLDDFLRERDCLEPPKEPEGAKYLQGCIPNTQFVALANDVKKNGSEDLRNWNSAFLEKTTEERNRLLNLDNILQGLRRVQGDALADNLLSVFEQMTQLAIVHGEILYPREAQFAPESANSPDVEEDIVEDVSIENIYIEREFTPEESSPFFTLSEKSASEPAPEPLPAERFIGQDTLSEEDDEEGWETVADAKPLRAAPPSPPKAEEAPPEPDLSPITEIAEGDFPFADCVRLLDELRRDTERPDYLERLEHGRKKWLESGSLSKPEIWGLEAVRRHLKKRVAAESPPPSLDCAVVRAPQRVRQEE